MATDDNGVPYGDWPYHGASVARKIARGECTDCPDKARPGQRRCAKCAKRQSDRKRARKLGLPALPRGRPKGSTKKRPCVTPKRTSTPEGK